jgi:hypothetical protein
MQQRTDDYKSVDRKPSSDGNPIIPCDIFRTKPSGRAKPFLVKLNSRERVEGVKISRPRRVNPAQIMGHYGYWLGLKRFHSCGLYTIMARGSRSGPYCLK